ncbi:MAG: TerB family tellurite resistance protein [Candidatus Marinimicrobia bacterium]|nr:TerB family tellurite resistance protein [Candidatus Neomarinimicrobiota bacterium]
MSKWTGTLIGGGIGWALFGPLGALFGAYIGSMFTREASIKGAYFHPRIEQEEIHYKETHAGDFAVAMLSLFAYVSKSDKQVKSSEVQYVKQFLVDKFGKSNAQDLMYLYKEILNKDYNIVDISSQIRSHMNYYSRLELLHILFGIAKADGIIYPSEISAINEIANSMGISTKDYNSIKSIFIGDSNQAYNILNVNPNDDTDTIKKAYRELAIKYHPDKVANLGPEIQQLAEEKFKSINNAYQAIRKDKGF